MRHRNLTIFLAAAGLIAAACGGGDDGEAVAPEAQIVVAAADSGTSEGEIVVADVSPDTAPPADGSIAASGAAASDEEQALEFAQCMRDEGLDWPDPITNADGSIDLFAGRGPGGAGGGGGGGIDEATQAGLEVCGELIEGASFLPGGGGGFDEDIQDTFLEFAQCLRDQGLDVDDPDLSGGFPAAGDRGGGGGGLFGDGFDPQDPANADALEACQGLFAGGFGAGQAGG